jgi:hypothetical protein
VRSYRLVLLSPETAAQAADLAYRRALQVTGAHYAPSICVYYTYY